MTKELIMAKSMLELAHEFIVAKKKAVTFKEIWQYVQKQVDEEITPQVGRFYKLLTLDGRFVALGNNKWDLKSRYNFKQLYDDARGVFRDVEAIEEGGEEVEADPFDEDEDDAEERDEETGKKRKVEDEE
jgi:DNA-directed RNA polymerase subunit delta